MATFNATIQGKDFDALADLVRKYDLTIARHTVSPLAQGGFQVEAHVPAAALPGLRAAGYQVACREDVEVESLVRMKENLPAPNQPMYEVAKADRYLAVDEIEAALQAAASGPCAKVVQLIHLPKPTWEHRSCTALRLGAGPGKGSPAICLLGGVHAREWGSPDILLHFIQCLLECHRQGTGLTLGGKTFTAQEMRSILEDKVIYVFPQANPDGREHSMKVAPMWRKNRRPAPSPGAKPSCHGVDINRNFDCLWDFPKYFHPDAPVQSSTSPCDPQTYIGPSACSEPETQNIVWLFETYGDIGYFVDLHSYSESILYGWGDAAQQLADPSMSFQNPAYDGKRGLAPDKGYQEYCPAGDWPPTVALATQMQQAICAVRGNTAYAPENSFSLYPTSGISTDYTTGRYLIDPSKGRILSYTIEWGNPKNPTPFHPPYPEMKHIIQEITAGLVEFCLQAK